MYKDVQSLLHNSISTDKQRMTMFTIFELELGGAVKDFHPCKLFKRQISCMVHGMRKDDCMMKD